MIKILTAILYTTRILTQYCKCLHLIDLPSDSRVTNSKPKLENKALDMYGPEPYATVKSTERSNRRYWLVNEPPSEPNVNFKSDNTYYEDEKDTDLKNKIVSLVNHTVHETQKRLNRFEKTKDEYREQLPYKAGFVLSVIKKTRATLNELYNVAMKHRQSWKALEQLKVFELIVHTNVDTTNLLRQLVDIHLSYLNATKNTEQNLKRVILI